MSPGGNIKRLVTTSVMVPMRDGAGALVRTFTNSGPGTKEEAFRANLAPGVNEGFGERYEDLMIRLTRLLDRPIADRSQRKTS